MVFLRPEIFYSTTIAISTFYLNWRISKTCHAISSMPLISKGSTIVASLIWEIEPASLARQWIQVLGECQISLCQLADQNIGKNISVEKLTPLLGPDPHRCEKNWLPFCPRQLPTCRLLIRSIHHLSDRHRNGAMPHGAHLCFTTRFIKFSRICSSDSF